MPEPHPAGRSPPPPPATFPGSAGVRQQASAEQPRTGLVLDHQAVVFQVLLQHEPAPAVSAAADAQAPAVPGCSTSGRRGGHHLLPGSPCPGSGRPGTASGRAKSLPMKHTGILLSNGQPLLLRDAPLFLGMSRNMALQVALVQHVQEIGLVLAPVRRTPDDGCGPLLHSGKVPVASVRPRPRA